MSYGYHGFRHALALRESSGRYDLVNTLGFLGAYQFGEGALIDLGFVNDDGRWWDNDFSGGWRGKFGIESRAEFLASPDAQDRAANEWFPLIWGYLKAVGADDYVGDKIDGIRISPSGLIAGAHLLGAGNVRDWLASGGSLDLRDAYGTPIAEYIGMFSGYALPFATGFADLADLIGPAGALPSALRARIEAVFERSHDVVLGGNGTADSLHGDGRANILAGGGRGDVIDARAGGDVALGGAGGDRISGGAGNDFLQGGAGNDRLAGDGGSDRLIGGAGNDRLAGGGGDDTLVGGRGDDVLRGGHGADLFVFRSPSGVDRITDFNPGQDRIKLAPGTGITSFQELMEDHARPDHGDVVIEFSGQGGGSLTLEGVRLGALSADDFLF